MLSKRAVQGFKQVVYSEATALKTKEATLPLIYQLRGSRTRHYPLRDLAAVPLIVAYLQEASLLSNRPKILTARKNIQLRVSVLFIPLMEIQKPQKRDSKSRFKVKSRSPNLWKI